MRVLIALGLAIVVVLGLFPPWHLAFRTRDISCGYSFVAVSPGGCRIDATRLFVEWAAVTGVVAIFAIVLLWKSTGPMLRSLHMLEGQPVETPVADAEEGWILPRQKAAEIVAQEADRLGYREGEYNQWLIDRAISLVQFGRHANEAIRQAEDEYRDAKRRFS